MAQPYGLDQTGDPATGLHAYRCEACGASATWRPSTQQVACRSCGSVTPLPAADPTPAASFFLVPYLRDSPENRRTFAPVRVERPCPTCSDAVVFEPGFEGTTCRACLTPLLRPLNESDMPIRPTGVVPFRIDDVEARERLRAWWRDLRGSDLRTRHLEPGPLVARYLPYWQFSVRVHCSWRHTATNSRGDKHVTSGEIAGDYGEHEPGSHRLPASLLQALPSPFAHAVAYDRRYLAGAVVEQYEGDLFQAWSAAHARLDDLVKRLVNKDAGVFGGPDERWPSWSHEKGWLILRPFYTTDIEYRGDRHHIIIDGHSGQFASAVPPFISLGMRLLLGGVLAGLIALVWLAIGMWRA